jgi:diaminopimelate decarboxylase
VSTSEVSVSLTVDETRALPQIVDELRGIAQVDVTPDAAIVCVVGEGMRRARGIPARIFRAVGNADVRMISQGASEINVSLVVAASEADAVVRRLHDEFFAGNLPQRVFGEAFADLETHAAVRAGTPQPQHRLAAIAHRLAATHGTPFYVYELDRIEAQVQHLRQALQPVRARVAYACKANFHPEVFRTMQRLGVGIDAVSPMEAARALECGIAPGDVLFTANNVGLEDLLALHDRGVRVNLGSLSDVQRFAAARPGSPVFLRVNPGVGDGHHEHVVTGGVDSKFGILEPDLPAALEALAAQRVQVVGLHAHIGSGILDPEPLLESAWRLADVASRLPDVRVLNIGGGLGVPYRDDEHELDLGALAQGLRQFVSEIERRLGRAIELWVEPGRYLVAQAGTLVARVTCRKESAGRVYIGLDTGMNHLLRPALYGAYHRVRNLSAPQAPREFVDVVGNICESADVLAFNRPLPRALEGHLIAIEDTGAYGYAMASHYNLWPLPREFVLRGGEPVDAPQG